MLTQTDYGTFEYELAKRWSPIHWQAVHRSYKWRWDLLTAVDFDGDWKTIGNWAAMDHHPLEPVVYFSVVESLSHWFNIYAFYHPRDWTASGLSLDQHENDVEGLLAIIEKPGSLASQFPYGQLRGVITIAHNHFYSYTNYLSQNRESIDGPLFHTMSDGDGRLHPCTRQEDEGHGCYALQPTDSRAWDDLGKPIDLDDRDARTAFEFATGEGVRYYHGDSAAEPTAVGPVTQHDVPYVLVDIFEDGGLWDRRCGGLNEPYTAANRLAGREYEDDKASPPWAWNDKDDADVLGEGVIATDPALLVRHYFSGLGWFSHTYANNPYASPPVCGSGFDRRVFSMRGIAPSDAAGTRLTMPEVQRQLRSMMESTVRQDVAASLIRRADRNTAFRKRLESAARSSVKSALSDSARGRRGPDPSTRAHLSIPAIHVLGRYQDKSSRGMLVKLVQSSTDRDVLLAALEALGNLSPGNERGLKDALERLLNHGDQEVRGAAARLYADTFARRDARPLARLLADPNSDVRAAALTGLGRSSDLQLKKEIDDALMKAAEDVDESPDVRAAATRAMVARSPAVRRRPRAAALRHALVADAGPDSLTDTPRNREDYANFAIAKALRD